MKEWLKKLISAKQARAAELRKLIEKATTVDEVKRLGNELTVVEQEEREAQKLIQELSAAN